MPLKLYNFMKVTQTHFFGTALMFDLLRGYLVVLFNLLFKVSLSTLKSPLKITYIIIIITMNFKNCSLHCACISARPPISSRDWYLSGENTLQFNTIANETKLSRSVSLIYASLDF